MFFFFAFYTYFSHQKFMPQRLFHFDRRRHFPSACKRELTADEQKKIKRKPWTHNNDLGVPLCSTYIRHTMIAMAFGTAHNALVWTTFRWRSVYDVQRTKTTSWIFRLWVEATNVMVMSRMDLMNGAVHICIYKWYFPQFEYDLFHFSFFIWISIRFSTPIWLWHLNYTRENAIAIVQIFFGVFKFCKQK